MAVENWGVSLERLTAPKAREGAPKEGGRVELKGLQYGADVSGRDTPATAPDLDTGPPNVMPLALKAPGKLGGVTGGWRDEGAEGVIYSLKYSSKAERGVRGVKHLLVNIHQSLS